MTVATLPMPTSPCPHTGETLIENLDAVLEQAHAAGLAARIVPRSAPGTNPAAVARRWRHRRHGTVQEAHTTTPPPCTAEPTTRRSAR